MCWKVCNIIITCRQTLDVPIVRSSSSVKSWQNRNKQNRQWTNKHALFFPKTSVGSSTEFNLTWCTTEVITALKYWRLLYSTLVPFTLFTPFMRLCIFFVYLNYIFRNWTVNRNMQTLSKKEGISLNWRQENMNLIHDSFITVLLPRDTTGNSWRKTPSSKITFSPNAINAGEVPQTCTYGTERIPWNHRRFINNERIWFLMMGA